MEEGYSDQSRFQERLNTLESIEGVAVRVLTKTRGGMPVSLVTLGTEEVAAKPAILIVGNVVAPHIVGSEIALGIAESLAQMQDDDDIEELLERFTLYFIPRPNPSGTERFFSRPIFALDGNDRPTDDDRDHTQGEDPPEDLNGDGFITQMRILDTDSGQYVPHPQEPRLLLAADPAQGEKGMYRLLTEGIDNDKDDAWNEDPGGGVSFNRNFTAKYPYFAVGAGPHQVSEDETRAIADFCFDHPNIAAIVCFSPEDNLFFPPKASSDSQKIKTSVLTEDAPLIEHLAKEYQEIHGGKKAPKPSEGHGSFSDWAYFHYGRWSFAARGWWIPPVDGEEKKDEDKKKKEKEDDRLAYERRALAYFDANEIDGYVPWTKIDHPDFPGKVVEVGGIKPFLLLNPPASEIPALVDKHVTFVQRLAANMPRLAVSQVEVVGEPNAEVQTIRVTIGGEGFLPTMSQMGSLSRIPYPVRWELKLPKGGKILAGTRRGQLGVLGRGESETIEWLVLSPEAKARPQLHVVSPSVGSITIPLVQSK